VRVTVAEDSEYIEDIVALEMETVEELIVRPSTETVGDTNEDILLAADAEVKLAAAEDITGAAVIVALAGDTVVETVDRRDVERVDMSDSEIKEDVVDSEMDPVVIVTPDTEVVEDNNVESIILDMVALTRTVDPEDNASGINVDIVLTTVELLMDDKLPGDGAVDDMITEGGATVVTAGVEDLVVAPVATVEVSLAKEDVKETDDAVPVVAVRLAVDVTDAVEPSTVPVNDVEVALAVAVDIKGVEVAETAVDVDFEVPLLGNSDVVMLLAESAVVLVELAASDDV